jgi:hypothetical protein
MEKVFDAHQLRKILKYDASKQILNIRESIQVELKESFNFSEIAEYLRDFAAFANNKGGYLIFGVGDSPHILKGVDKSMFDAIDEEKITGFINEYFAPAIDWDKSVLQIHGRFLGLIYVYQSSDKPVMAIKDGGRGQEIKNGEIYFRYHGRSQKIRYSELKAIFDKKLDLERVAWKEHIEKMVQIGPKNAAILDTVKGKIESSSGTVIIDDNLIPKLKFIREGQFVETKGKPTLKLVGELRPASIVHKVVHDDPYIYKPTDVCKIVESKLGKRFTVNNHTTAWKLFKIRKETKNGVIECDPKYADYKATLKYVLYSEFWIKFLIKQLSDASIYKKITQPWIKTN